MNRRILWFAFVFSTLLYGVLAYATERNFVLQPILRDMRRPVAIALYVLAVAMFGAAYAVSARMGRRPASDAGIGSIGSAYAVRLALFDAVAMAGLVAAAVVHDWRLYIPAWALALAGFFSSYPAERA